MPIFSVWCQSKARLDGKTAIITGCNTGIGKETVADFYKRGARVIMACRSVDKAEITKNEILKECGKMEKMGEIVVVKLDLLSLASVRECADHILKTESKINILVNNAGIMMCPEGKTEDGFETTIGTNHFAHFLFTLLLFPRIRNSKPARIVNVSALAHKIGEINFEDINFEKRKYSPLAAYTQSKLANILFTNQLAKIIKQHNIDGVNVYSLHPGVIHTELSRHTDTTLFPGATFIFKWVAGWFVKTPIQGAQTTIYCSVDEKCENETGLYYSDCAVADISDAARNEESAEKLWKLSEKLVGLENWNPLAVDSGISNKVRLDEKTAIVTGCNTGIGKETVLDFYKRGARVIMACRNLEKAEAAKNDIVKKCEKKKLTNLGEMVIVKLDLLSLASVRECADHILKTEPKINILVNNAGVMICPQGKTGDGFETQFGTNHLAHFLFTLLLFPRIRSSAPARIVNVSSMAHKMGRGMLFDDINFEKTKYSPGDAYAQSKLSNILFTKQLAKIIQNNKISGVNVYCLHPGVIDTDLMRHADTAFFPGSKAIYKATASWFIKSPEQGAQTQIYCAVDEKCANETGLYYSDCVVVSPSKIALNTESMEKLWEISEKFVGIENWDPLEADKGISS